MFSVAKIRSDCGFVQMPDIQPGSIPEHLSVEWRLAKDEGNGKPQLFRIELTRGSNVGDKELRFGGKKCRFGQSFSEYIVHRVDRAPRSTEEQDVAVRVRNLEAAKTVVGILKGHAECCAITGKSIGKFDGERIGVWCIDEGIPPHGGIAPGVRQGRRVFIGLDEDLRSVAADDSEKRVSIRLLESRLKAKFVAVKCDGLIDVADDEER